MAGILWKQSSERDGNLVILFPEDPGTVVIKDKETGKVIATGTNSGASNNFGATIRFDKPGSSFKNVIVELGSGESFYIDDGSIRRENIIPSPKGTKPEGPTGTPVQGGATGGAGEQAGEEGSARVPGVPGVAPPIPIDPNLIQPFPISPSFIPQANFNFTDPLEFTGKTAEFNREQSQLAFETGLSRAKQIQQEELASIMQFAQGMSQFQQQLVGEENQFNQQQRIQAAETAIPGVQDIFVRQRERAETFAEGKLLTTAEDRAYELAAQSASAEGNFVRGFGDDSVVGQTTSEKLSAQQRLGLTQLGENFLSRSLQQAAGVLMDVPLKASISQRLPSQPNVPFAQVAGSQQAAETALTTIAPQAALSSQVQQEQFQTNLEQNTNQFNANMQFNSDQFNSSQFYSAMLEQLGITVYNAQQYQNYLQNIFNAQAQGEQLEEARQRYDQLLSDYKKNRDKNQLIQGIAAIAGSLGKVPDFVWNGIKEFGMGFVNEVAEAIGYDPPFDTTDDSGSSSTSTSDTTDTGGSTDEGNEVANETPGGDTEETGETEQESGEETTTTTPPEENTETPEATETPEDTERMLVYNPKTGRFRYRFFTEDMLERLSYDPELTNFASGADIHLTRKQLRSLKGLY